MLRATEMGQGETASPPDFKLRKSPRCRTSERLIHASRRGCGGGARGGHQAPTVGGVANGEGKQESLGVGENACVFSEEDWEEIPSQVSNTDNELFYFVAVFGHVASTI